jgi:hypothetical protein
VLPYAVFGWGNRPASRITTHRAFGIMLQHCYLTSGCLSNLPLRGLTVQPRALAPGYLGPGSALQVAPDERCAPDCVCCLDVFLRLITSTANSLKLRPRTPLVRRFVLVLVVALPPSLKARVVERASLARPTLSIKRKLRRTGCLRFVAGGVLEYWSIGVLRLLRIAPRGRGVGGAFGAIFLT